MAENAANRSDKLPACRQRGRRVKAVDKQAATAHLRLVASSARIGQFEFILCEGPAGELGKGRDLNTKNQV